MNLLLKRITNSLNFCSGELYINGTFFCYTLEDTNRGLTQVHELELINKVKINGKTAIPKGTYKVIISYSPRFKKLLPLLLNVKGFKGIRIHSGNTPEHTEGCILVGANLNKDYLFNSRFTFLRLMTKMQRANKKEPIIIEIV